MTSYFGMRRAALGGVALLACAALLGTQSVSASGEAGPINLRDQGFFWVGTRTKQVELAGRPGAPPRTGTVVEGQMYVGFQLAAKKRHKYPLVLIHGGGGQATDWMGTPDGRDGWLDYFLVAGFDVYFVDRPAHGRSPNVRSYGELGAPQSIAGIAAFTSAGKQYPGGGTAETKEVIQHTASSEPGPTVSPTILKENLAEMLDRIGPAIVITHSNGGPSGWLALDARPNLVKAVLAIEPGMGITENLAPFLTFQPALAAGERIETEQVAGEAPGQNPCRLQPKDKVRTLPAYAGKKMLFVESPFSPFTGNVHCSVKTANQVGADAKLALLTDYKLQGNGHFMNEELNNGEIVKKVFIPWLSSIK